RRSPSASRRAIPARRASPIRLRRGRPTPLAITLTARTLAEEVYFPRKQLGGEDMPRWQPKTPVESMQTQLERLMKGIEDKEAEVKELEGERKQVEAAIKALSG